MNANTFVWDQRGYALIYGFTREQLWDFSGAYLARNLKICGKIYDCITNYKKKRKYETIVDVLVEQMPRKERKDFKENLLRHSKQAGLEKYISRAPYSMGGNVGTAWTCLSAALQGEKKFIVYDYGSYDDCVQTACLVKWLLSYDSNISILWLSSGTEEVLTWNVFPNGQSHVDGAGALLYMNGGEFETADKEAVIARYEARLAEERARKEAEMAAKLQQAADLEKAGHWQEAFDQCMALAEQGYKEAGNRVVRMCLSKIRHNQNSYEYRELAKKAALESGSGEAFVMLGDYAMEIIKKHEDPTCRDKDYKSFMVYNLKDAHDYYYNAAGLGSAEGCYKGARLHLSYTFSTGYSITNSEGRTTYHERHDYDKSSSIYFIKKLLAMEDKGENVDCYLVPLYIFDSDGYVRRARQEYEQEK